MENKEVARVIQEIADLLELQEGNPFRIRSFRRAAQVIENLSFPAVQAALEAPEKLRGIPGLGEGTLRKIRELAESGRCREHQELLAEVPASLLPMLELQNVGPKKLRLFWKELGILTLEELEKAARAGKLRSLPGMGERSEEKVIKAIQEYRRTHGRFRLDDGIEVTSSLIHHLRQHAPVGRVSEAGSVRRRQETIGDVDLLVTSPAPERVMEAFLQYPGIREVLARGETKSSVLLSRGLQVDLRVLDDQSFGAALQYFTGSKAHNVLLRERAKRMGYKISEYGLFRLDDQARLGGAEEEEIYQALGLPLIPPELREGRGEIDRAARGELPELIRLQDIRGDLHLHTKATDGQDSIETMAREAGKRGYQYVAITDHSKALAMAGGLDEERLLRHVEEIRRLQSLFEPELQLLAGIEVDILADGELDLSDRVLAQLDVVVASVHSRFNMSAEEMTRRICRAISNPHVNILGHPTGRLLLRREGYPLNLEEVLRVARENRVCLEINAHPQRLDLNDLHCRMAREMGVLLSINSDSHNREMLRYMLYGIFTARRGWLRAQDVINTFPLSELRKVLRKEAYPT